MTTSVQLVDELGISYRQLDYWIRQGWLTPHNAHSGSGSQRDFRGSELTVAKRMGRLVAIGFHPALAARIARSSLERGRYFELLNDVALLNQEVHP